MFDCAEAELLEEEAEMNQGAGDSGKGVLRRRRRAYSRTLPEHMKPSKQSGQDPGQHRDSNMGTWHHNEVLSSAHPSMKDL